MAPLKRINSYAKGRAFEYRTRDSLRNDGWFVVRQARSAFPDLVAIRQGWIMLVECKTAGYISREERRKILRLTHQLTGGKAVLAFQRENSVLFKELSYSPKNDKEFDLQDFEIFQAEIPITRDTARELAAQVLS